MTHNQSEHLHYSTLIIAVLSVSIHDGLRTTASVAARPFFFLMMLNTALAILLINAINHLPPSMVRFAAVFACGALAFGLIQTFLQTLLLWNKIFPGSFSWLILAYGLIVFWHPSVHALNCTGWVLRWCILLAFTMLLFGVWSQLHWQNLSFDLVFTPSNLTLIRFRPEYLALALQHQPNTRCSKAALPAVDCLTRFLLILLSELVFGSSLSQQLEHGELLRAWGMGIFSRSDSLVLSVWLMTAFFRFMLLKHMLKQMYSLFSAKGAPLL